MSTKRRTVFVGHWHHVTTRTLEGQYFLEVFARSQAHAGLFWGVVSEAARRYRVDVAIGVAMSGHIHLMVRPWTAVDLSRLVQYVKARTAELVRVLLGRPGQVWEIGYRCSPILDDEAERMVFRYILSHGTKCGLVEAPSLWPGPNAVAELCAGQVVAGRLLNARAWRRARQRDPSISFERFTTPVTLPLTPLTAYATDPTGFAQWCNEQVAELVREHADRTFVGVEAVKQTRWQDKPAELSRRPFSRFIAAGPDAAARLREAESSWADGVRASAIAAQNLVRAGCVMGVEQPPGFQWPAYVLAQFAQETPGAM